MELIEPIKNNLITYIHIKNLKKIQSTDVLVITHHQSPAGFGWLNKLPSQYLFIYFIKIIILALFI